jgi:molecular chaperone DnaK (HSP70)
LTQNELLNPAFKASRDLINDALAEAQLKDSDIDELLLIGDTNRVPNFKEMLEKHLSMRAIQNSAIEPDQAVTIGAAYQGSILSDNYGMYVGCPPLDVATAFLGMVRDLPQENRG